MAVRRLVSAFLAVIALAWFATLPAYAGGPTSVLLVNPDAQRVHGYYYSDPEYEALTAVLGEMGGASTQRPEAVAEEFAATVRLTWLVHDMYIWKIDEVYLTAGDGIWIGTRSEPVDKATTMWHRATSDSRLRGLLDRAGLLGGAPTPASPPVTELPPSPSVAAGEVRASGGSGLPIALGSGLIGVALGAAGTVLLRRTRSAERRVQLVG